MAEKALPEVSDEKRGPIIPQGFDQRPLVCLHGLSRGECDFATALPKGWGRGAHRQERELNNINNLSA